MTATSRTPLGLGRLVFAALAVAALPAAADEIELKDGSLLEDVDVLEEGLKEVTYRRDRSSIAVPSDDVLAVRYEEMPEPLDEARSFVVEGDLYSALQYIDSYVDGQIERATERRFRWAPAYGAWRAVELRMRLAELDGVVADADRLVTSFPESRYVPYAYLAKVDAQRRLGDLSGARRTLDALASLVSSAPLSKRWDLERRLAQLQVDGRRDGPERRSDFALIADEAGSQFPVVRLRALVAQGESFLKEAERTNDSSAAQALRDQAQALFELVVADEAADDAALAAAYTGLGDCVFLAGAAQDDDETLRDAVKHFLRVVTLHQEQSEYVPKALFYAMRCFHIMGQLSRRNDMVRELVRLYPDSDWAKRPEVQNAR